MLGWGAVNSLGLYMEILPAIYLQVIYIITGWWFQPLWKIWVSWDYYSQYMEKYFKPPTRLYLSQFYLGYLHGILILLKKCLYLLYCKTRYTCKNYQERHNGDLLQKWVCFYLQDLEILPAKNGDWTDWTSRNDDLYNMIKYDLLIYPIGVVLLPRT